MHRDTKIGNMIEKFSRGGTPTKIFYELELKKYVEAKNKTD